MWQIKTKILAIISVVLISCVCLPVAAQRVVTPVESNDLPIELQKKEAAKASNAAKEQVEKAAQSKKDSVDVAATDTTLAEKKQEEVFRGILLTADISAPIMNLFGTQYGNYEVAIEVDLLHRFFPVVEVGVGHANYTPEGNNYTFLCNPSVYGRVGLNYNFFYKSPANSFIAVGVRYGLSAFSYSLQNVTLSDPYWGIDYVTNTPQQNAFAHWGELVAALRVQVYKNFYMGFSGRYRILIGCSASDYGEPYFIPGFGPKNSGFGFTYVVGYNLPIGTKKKEIKLP